ncbi:kelch-like protein 40a [Halichondria panicea]|uniref:kelch-like protein 40a n=1 Tax=Halichondria panicea TaxID=6063 RepID=UPI00312B8EC9
MSSPIDAAVHGDKAYFRVYRSRRIYLYNLTHGGWSKLVKCLVKDSSLVMLPVAYKGGVRFLLHTVGGIKRTKDQQGPDDEYTDDIYQFSDPACRQWTRSISYPKLKTKRSQVTVVFSDGCLIIAGGSSAHGPVNTVHVLIVTCQDKVWREVACLPYKVFRASGSVCNGMLYILGGYVSPFDPIRSACVATVSKLVESNSNDQGIFSTIKDLELSDSACVSFRNSILAIGGWKKLGSALTDQPKGTKLVHVYDTSRNIWKELKGQLSEPRCFAFAAAFEDKQKIMIVGGYDRPNGTCTNSVEFSIIN